jgi:hypothetical protein
MLELRNRKLVRRKRWSHNPSHSHKQGLRSRKLVRRKKVHRNSWYRSSSSRHT